MLNLFGLFGLLLLTFHVVEGRFEEMSRNCKIQFQFFDDALKDQRGWAMEMFDAWGKFQYGVLVGNVYNFGDYDHCIGFKHATARSDIGTLRGKHCMVSHTGIDSADEYFNITYGWRELGMIAKSKELSITTGICVPDTCSTDDVLELAIYVSAKSSLNVTSVSCEPNRSFSFKIRSVAIVIFAALLLTVILCTMYEIYANHIGAPPCMTLIAFSLHTNGKNLFTMTRAKSNKSIECLNGLRSLSLLWIIFGHRYFDMFMAPATNSVTATENWLGNFLSLSHTTFHLAVDTFFLMGGLLVTWTFMKSFDSKDFNIFKIYFHRFLRYTPVLLFLLLFFISFMPFLGSGPMFDISLDSWLPNCYDYWWSTILHVSTYTNIDRLCLNWTWYLAADFQLFVLSPILIYPAWRWRWKFFAVFPVMILLSQVYIFAISMVYEFLVFVGPLQPIGQYDYDRLIYYPTHARCGPWLVGMNLGFIMYQFREVSPRINKTFSKAMWMVSISLLLAVVLGYFPFQQADRYLEIPRVVNATYNALYRSCWAVALAWIIFTTHNGSGGIIGWFLCLPFFQPLARMSLSIYLTHRVYQILSVASIRQPIYLSPVNLLHVFFGDIVMSLIVGIIVYLCIEAPLSILEHRLFQRKSAAK